MLALAFLGILVLTFGLMAVMTNPSQSDKAIERRIVDIKHTGLELSATRNELAQLLKVETVSNFTWLEGLLEKYKLTTILETRIYQADSKTTVIKLLSSCGGLAVVGFILCYIFVQVAAVALVAALVAGYIPYALLSFKRSRRLGAFDKGLPDSIDMMGRALRAGHSMAAAIGMVAEQAVEPVKGEFSEVFKQQNFGLPLRDALLQMVERVPSPDLRVLVTGILVQRETGGNLTEILDRIVSVIRERLRIQGEIRTHTAQGRMTGWILCALPVVMLFLINLVNPGYSKVLMDTPTGHKLIYVGLGLLTMGGLIIRAIVNGIEV